MPLFFIVFVLFCAACVVVIICDPPITRRPLDRLAKRWRGVRADAPSPDARLRTGTSRPGSCAVTMRSYRSMDCYWPCLLDDGHGGLHEWSYHDHVVRFTTSQATRSHEGGWGHIAPSYIGPRDGAA